MNTQKLAERIVGLLMPDCFTTGSYPPESSLEISLKRQRDLFRDEQILVVRSMIADAMDPEDET